jgi:hypothetical protein
MLEIPVRLIRLLSFAICLIIAQFRAPVAGCASPKAYDVRPNGRLKTKNTIGHIDLEVFRSEHQEFEEKTCDIIKADIVTVSRPSIQLSPWWEVSSSVASSRRDTSQRPTDSLRRLRSTSCRERGA